MSVREIRQDDLSGEAVQALLRLHLVAMRDNSPPGHSFALDWSGLKQPEVVVWTAWEGETLLGMAALKDLGDRAGEVKSMRTHPDHLRRGVAAALLEHLIDEARRRGMTRLSLETGSGESFEPALALYRRRGFVPGEPFADYPPSPFNQYFHLTLGPRVQMPTKAR